MKFLSGKLGAFSIIAMCVGFYISFYSWDGLVYFFDRDTPRIPATIKERFQQSGLRSISSLRNVKEDILENSKIIKQNDKSIIEIGTLVINDREGHRRSACRIYDKVIVTFSAVGITSSSGDPTLSIHTPCKESSDQKTISTIVFPSKKILNIGIIEPTYKVNEKQSVYFENVFDEWPVDWQLIKIELKSSIDPLLSLDVEFVDDKKKLTLNLE